MKAKVKETGKVLKNVEVYERSPLFNYPLTYIDKGTNTIYKAVDLEIAPSEPLKEQEVDDLYQERSNTSGERANQLAWAFIIILCAQLIGDSHYAEPYVMAAGGILYMLLSIVQSLWQAVSIWIVKQLIQDGQTYDDYPDWVGGVTWFFYYTKMIVLTITSIYAVWHFMKLL